MKDRNVVDQSEKRGKEKSRKSKMKQKRNPKNDDIWH